MVTLGKSHGNQFLPLSLSLSLNLSLSLSLSLLFLLLLFRRKAMRMCMSVGLTGNMWMHLARVNLPFFQILLPPFLLLLLPSSMRVSRASGRRGRRGRTQPTLHFEVPTFLKKLQPPEKWHIMTAAFAVEMNFSFAVSL